MHVILRFTVELNEDLSVIPVGRIWTLWELMATEGRPGAFVSLPVSCAFEDEDEDDRLVDFVGRPTGPQGPATGMRFLLWHDLCRGVVDIEWLMSIGDDEVDNAAVDAAGICKTILGAFVSRFGVSVVPASASMRVLTGPDVELIMGAEGDDEKEDDDVPAAYTMLALAPGSTRCNVPDPDGRYTVM